MSEATVKVAHTSTETQVATAKKAPGGERAMT